MPRTQGRVAIPSSWPAQFHLALANVPFRILGNKIDILYAASENDYLGLPNLTTGKCKVNLSDSNVRPLELFMCSIVCKMGYVAMVLSGFPNPYLYAIQ
ncbi:hypothetical protein G4B88_030807, partial [Cannabis sativa]